MKNRIITCSDGTWNEPDKYPTNVARIFNCIADEAPDGSRQLKAYDKGVGTGYSTLDKIIGGATGKGLDRNIKDMYMFLTMAYKPGDDLYLFGFSRGAYTARSLGGLIYNCSILRPEYVHLVDTAFDLYRNRNSLTKPSSALMQAFRDNYCHPRPKIKFIGVWDTVGSLGVPVSFLRNKERFLFHDCQLNKEVEHAYHTLAVEERRRLFTPTLWEMTPEAMAEGTQVLEQRWFPGAHSNVGGGYPDNGISDIALQWLMQKAKHTGLHFDEACTKNLKPALNPNANGKRYNSHRPLPYTFMPPKWRSIKAKDNTFETLDESVTELLKTGKYKPRNLAKFAVDS